ncbi:MAG: TRAP transporter substrate-binding protein [Desulfovibrionaceae bacterium]
MLRKLCLAVLLVLFAMPANAAKIVMNCNAIYGPTNFHTLGAINYAKLVKDYTDGSVDITVHPGGSLGFKGPELLKSVKDGTLPMSDILMGVVAGSEEIFGISTMPLMVGSYPEAKKFYDIARPYYAKACERWNQKLLYAAPWPRSGLFTKKPVKSMADIAGLKTRTYDKNGAEFLKRAGANPQSLPWGEVYSALSTGLIDSVLTSATSGAEGKFWEVLNHFTKINYSYPLNMLTINMDYWKALDEDQREAMLRAAVEVEAAQWLASKASIETSLAAISKHGMIISEKTAGLAAELDAVAKAMREEFKAHAKQDSKDVLTAFGK